MPKRSDKMVIVDEKSTYGKKPPVVITSQGTPEHKRDPIYTMSAHDKTELFIEKMRIEREKQAAKASKKHKSIIPHKKTKKRGVKK